MPRKARVRRRRHRWLLPTERDMARLPAWLTAAMGLVLSNREGQLVWLTVGAVTGILIAWVEFEDW